MVFAPAVFDNKRAVAFRLYVEVAFTVIIIPADYRYGVVGIVRRTVVVV